MRHNHTYQVVAILGVKLDTLTVHVDTEQQGGTCRCISDVSLLLTMSEVMVF